MPTKNAASKICWLLCATSSRDVPRGTRRGTQRACASGKVKFRFDWCYLRQNTCKSDQCQVFFAGEGKIFSQTCSLCAGPRAHPGIIRAKAGMSRIICGNWPNLFEKRGAPIIVPKQCKVKVFFGQLCK